MLQATVERATFMFVAFLVEALNIK